MSMNVQTVKSSLEKGIWNHNSAIFKIKDSNFVAMQYIDRVAEIKNLQVEIVENISDVLSSSINLFETTSSKLYVYECDSFTDNYSSTELENIYIICKKLDEKFYTEYIEIPSITSDMIKDYVYTICPGVNPQKLDVVINNVHDMYKLQSEIDKLTIFPLSQQEEIFDTCLQEGTITFDTNNTIYDFVNKLFSLDIRGLRNIYQIIDTIDINEIGLVTLLLQQIRKYIEVKFTNNYSSTLSVSEKQFYYLKKAIPFSGLQLIKLYKFLTNMDYLLKTGQLEVKYWIDYIVINIFSIYTQK